jgi:hypothetical protein
MRARMRESDVLEFHINRAFVGANFGCALVFALGVVLDLATSASPQGFLPKVVGAVVWFVVALLSLRPYARVSSTDVAVNVTPIRPMKVIPWSSVQRASRQRSKVKLFLPDGKKVKLNLAWLSRSQQDAFVAALELHLGPLASAA